MLSALNRKLKGCLSVIWAFVIFIVSTVENKDISSELNVLMPHVDKVAHFLMYSVLQVLLMWQYETKGNTTNSKLIFIAVSSYGIFLEFIQKYFLVDRFFEKYDIIANITGALMGILFFHRIKT